MFFAMFYLCSAASFAFAGELKITCMEKLSGVPSEPVIYTFREETGELFSSQYMQGPLSTFIKGRLGHTIGDKGGSTSYVLHKWVKKGETLQRIVEHVPDQGSREKPWTFAEIYDFKNQTVFEAGDKKDSCYHSLYKKDAQ
jgi:hypothetical protein